MDIYSVLLAASGIFNDVFYWCVALLKDWAKQLGMTYEEINVWIFCIIEPLVLIILLIIIFRQRKKIGTLKAIPGGTKKQ